MNCPFSRFWFLRNQNIAYGCNQGTSHFNQSSAAFHGNNVLNISPNVGYSHFANPNAIRFQIILRYMLVQMKVYVQLFIWKYATTTTTSSIQFSRIFSIYFEFVWYELRFWLFSIRWWYFFFQFKKCFHIGE